MEMQSPALESKLGDLPWKTERLLLATLAVPLIDPLLALVRHLELPCEHHHKWKDTLRAHQPRLEV